MLKSVEFSFGMFCNNLHSYNVIKAKGERDALTGLYNRNRYEMDLLTYPDRYEHSLACVYIDVNGLHELNNSSGHEAGDNMLKTVAAQIRKMFGEQYTYRIGGDEFLAYVTDRQDPAVRKCVKDFVSIVGSAGYSVAVGVATESAGDIDVGALCRKAEKRMYLDKEEHYRVLREQQGR